MNDKELTTWLEGILPKHLILTTTVINIIQSLLNARKIDYLAVTGRSKDIDSAKDKVKRKSYNQPEKQLTDLSGIRIIAYFESDVDAISSVIENSFNVDHDNSLSKPSLATDQIGYRSVHYVCDLGNKRTELPEFSELKNLKFEIQVRTVLQHAWAELAHDRNYKFSGKLPREIERRLYLYAGMLEIADKGFDEISKEIDLYIEDFTNKTNKGDYDIELNSISLEEFIDKWARENNISLQDYHHRSDVSELVRELNEFGVNKINELQGIIPPGFAEYAKTHNYSTNIFGLLRDWMLISDHKKYYDNVNYTWTGFDPDGGECFSVFLPGDKVSEIYSLFDDEYE